MKSNVKRILLVGEDFSLKAFKQVVRAGIFEIVREPRLFFFILIFPLMFMAFFGIMGQIIPASETMGMSFFEFMFPGLLIFALLSIGLLGTSTPIIEMRKLGVLRLFELSPLSTGTFILAQISIRFILSFIQISLFMILGFILGYVTLGNLVPMILLSLLGIAFMLTLGFLFGGVFKSSEVASGVLSGLSAPLLMFSGVLLPLSIFPDFMKTVAMVFPFTYLGDAMRQVMFPDVPGDYNLFVSVLIIIGSSLILYLVSLKTFKWNLEKK